MEDVGVLFLMSPSPDLPCASRLELSCNTVDQAVASGRSGAKPPVLHAFTIPGPDGANGGPELTRARVSSLTLVFFSLSLVRVLIDQQPWFWSICSAARFVIPLPA
jgi:hypothetical protein